MATHNLNDITDLLARHVAPQVAASVAALPAQKRATGALPALESTIEQLMYARDTLEEATERLEAAAQSTAVA